MGNELSWECPVSEQYANQLKNVLGKPSCISSRMVLWDNNLSSPYIEVKVIDEYIKHEFPSLHYDFVYSTISLKEYGIIEPEHVSELAYVSGSIIVDLLKQEVTARCGGLTKNNVTLSFVIDVVQGRVEATPEEYAYRIKNDIITHSNLNLSKLL